MTVLEKFRAFTDRYSGKKATANYFVESLEESKLLLVTDNQFTLITEGDAGDDDKKVNITFKSVSAFEYFQEKPKDHPLVKSANMVLIKNDKHQIVMACAPYDYNKIVDYTAGKLATDTETDA